MKTQFQLFITGILAIGLIACNGKTNNNKEDLNTNQKIDSVQVEQLNSYASLFEIPATDITRAINFYKTILDIDIEKMEAPGMEMGIFPYENQVINGVIMKAEGYAPSANGITIYLNGGDNLQTILDKVEQHGGKIIVPKTMHADESGYFALFIDSEGNKMGLNSPN